MKLLLFIAALTISGSVFANTAYSNKAKNVKATATKQAEGMKDHAKKEMDAAKEKMVEKTKEVKQLGKNKLDSKSDTKGM